MLKNKILTSILTIGLISSFTNAQPIIDSDDLYDEMMASPDIFDPTLLDGLGDAFTFPDDVKAEIMNDGTLRVPVIEEVEFPLISEGVSSGKFSPYEISDPNFQMGEIPLCIIGTDKISQDWLEIRKDDLFANMISCIVVEAQNESSIQRLQDIAPKIFFNAMDASWLQHIHVNNYPAIIFQRKVFQ